MRALLAILLAISSPVFGAGSDGLIGTWKLISWQVIVENEPPQNVFGSNPKGYLILTREGRSIVVTTADNRKSGMGDVLRRPPQTPTPLHSIWMFASGELECRKRVDLRLSRWPLGKART